MPHYLNVFIHIGLLFLKHYMDCVGIVIGLAYLLKSIGLLFSLIAL